MRSLCAYGRFGVRDALGPLAALVLNEAIGETEMLWIVRFCNLGQCVGVSASARARITRCVNSCVHVNRVQQLKNWLCD